MNTSRRLRKDADRKTGGPRYSLLKSGIKGTYVSVEPFHLARYLDEQMSRYNNPRDMNDGQHFDLAVSQIVGKRLTYDLLTGKDAGQA